MQPNGCSALRSGLYDAIMDLDSVQIRILGCLMEKEATTPASYPLTTNALVTACNQASNRSPVVDYDERTVNDALVELRADGYVSTSSRGRTDRHRHRLDEQLSLAEGERAALAVLFLRGPQTASEIRKNTERYYPFADTDAVEFMLRELAARPQALVQKMERLPGHKQSRWVHLGGRMELVVNRVEETPVPLRNEDGEPYASGESQLSLLEARVQHLEAELQRVTGFLEEWGFSSFE